MVDLKDTPDYVHCLMISRLARNISEEEELYLEQLIRENAIVKKQWQDLRYQFPQERIDRYEELDWLDAAEITALPLHHNWPLLIIRWLAVVITIIMAVGLIILFFYRKHT
ncbi:hypothetical protein CLV51_1021235 [Chitinophaga niastensis]|uniref:Uncharacterized protein n=1 Tax=Chitinophaga niastensis TaxID=536980 RepID=A0A2P8HQ74_CHINA|nr:hypothetical protein [Chitinophaga niastensis]PSL48368.1 hypothetical protein CLV51_1021235 [Chitinophaga niastensis]